MKSIIKKGKDHNTAIIKLGVLGSGLLCVVLFVEPSSAQSDGVQAPPPYVPSNPSTSEKNGVIGESNVGNDGSFTYSYPILLPPGRGNADPSISLNYNSNNRTNGIVGVGFSLSVPTIERSTKYGLDYSKDDFIAGGKDLHNFGGYYLEKIDESFTKYFHHIGSICCNDNYWTVLTRDGMKYEYGNTEYSPDSHLEHASFGIFSWFLTKIEDPNGNQTKFYYFKNGNQVYLDYIEYTDSDISGTPMPMFKVTFNYDDNLYGNLYGNLNNDDEFFELFENNGPVSWQTHFPVRTMKRLSSIVVSENKKGTFYNFRKYIFKYSNNSVHWDNEDAPKDLRLSFLSEIKAEEIAESRTITRSTTTIDWRNNVLSQEPFIAGDSGIPNITPQHKIIHFDYDGDGQLEVLRYMKSGFINFDKDDMTFDNNYDINSDFPRIELYELNEDPIYGKRLNITWRNFYDNRFFGTLLGNSTEHYSVNYPNSKNLTEIVDVVAFDYNGDGKDDLLFWGGTPGIQKGNSDYPYQQDHMWLFKSLGNDQNGVPQFEYVSTSNLKIDKEFMINEQVELRAYYIPYRSKEVYQSVLQTAIIPFDLNGDGNQDLLIFNGYGSDSPPSWGGDPETSSYNANRGITVLKSNGDGSFDSIDNDMLEHIRSLDDDLNFYIEHFVDAVQPLDFNGDGYQDIALMKATNDFGGTSQEFPRPASFLCFFASTGAGFKEPQCGKMVFAGSLGIYLYFDFDDEGTGPISSATHIRSPYNLMNVLDYNGDGYDDLLVGSPATAKGRELVLFRSDGTGIYKVDNNDYDSYWLTDYTCYFDYEYPPERREEDPTDIVNSNSIVMFDRLAPAGIDVPDSGNSISNIVPIDYNYDGKTDLYFRRNYSQHIAISNGDGTFTEIPDLYAAPPTEITNNEDYNTGFEFVDLAGSGTPVIFEKRQSLSFIEPFNPDDRLDNARAEYFYSGFQEMPYLVESIKTLYGDHSDGTERYHNKISLEYEKSNKFSGNELMKQVMSVVKRMTTYYGDSIDSIGNILKSSTEYAYSGGYYDDIDRDFRGFGIMEKFLPNGTYQRETYETRNYFLKGKLLKRETYPLFNEEDESFSLGINTPTSVIEDYSWKYIYLSGDPPQGIENHGKLAGIAKVRLEKQNNTDKNFAIKTTVVDRYDDSPNKDYFDIKSSENINYYITRLNYEYYNENGLIKNEIREGIDSRQIQMPPVYNYYSYKNMGDWNWRKTYEAVYEETNGVKYYSRLKKNFYYQNTGNLHYQQSYRIEQGYWAGENYQACGETNCSEIVYEYDQFGNIIRLHDSKGNITRFSYDDNLVKYVKQVLLPTTSRGNVVISHTVYSDQFNYKFGTVGEKTDENGHKTFYRYDDLGRIKEIEQEKEPINALTTYVYNDEDFPRSIVKRTIGSSEISSPDVIETQTYIDGYGRKVQTITNGKEPQYISVVYDYNKVGMIEKTYGPFYCDGKGFYNKYGDTCSLDSTRKKEVKYDYIGRPFDIQVAKSGSNTAKTILYYLGLKSGTIDADGNKKEVISDYRGNIRQVIEYVEESGKEIEHKTTYNYNASGDLVNVFQPIPGNAYIVSNITYEYDFQGNRTRMSDPDMGDWLYYYDKNGNLETVVNNNGQTIMVEYDEMNRKTRKTSLKNNTLDSVTNFVYDYCTDDAESDNYITSNIGESGNWKGRLCASYVGRDDSPQNADSLDVYKYDEMGNTVWELREIAGAMKKTNIQEREQFITEMQYDAAGRPKLLTYPDLTQIRTYYYQGTSLISGVADPSKEFFYATFDNYDPMGKIGTANYGLRDFGDYATKTQYTYDPYTANLTDIRTMRQQGGVEVDLQHNSYSYSDYGDITRVGRLRNGVMQDFYYEYDNLHRLTAEKFGSINTNYIEEKTENHFGLSTLHAVDSSIYSGLTPPRMDTYEYNEAGNMTEMTKGVSQDPLFPYLTQTNILYNAENMPRGISRYGVDWDVTGNPLYYDATTQFMYDSYGQRTAKLVDDQHSNWDGSMQWSARNWTFYVSDIYEEHKDVDGTKKIKYIFVGNQRVAQIVTEETSSGEVDKLYYLHTDHLGSTTVVTDENGDTLEELGEPGLIEYEPFGSPRVGSKTSTVTDYNFTGQEWDESTGLYNYNARLYNPELGMFISPDPIIQNLFDPQTINRYTYVRNNPLMYIDPSGYEQLTSTPNTPKNDPCIDCTDADRAQLLEELKESARVDPELELDNPIIRLPGPPPTDILLRADGDMMDIYYYHPYSEQGIALGESQWRIKQRGYVGFNPSNLAVVKPWQSKDTSGVTVPRKNKGTGETESTLAVNSEIIEMAMSSDANTREKGELLLDYILASEAAAHATPREGGNNVLDSEPKVNDLVRNTIGHCFSNKEFGTIRESLKNLGFPWRHGGGRTTGRFADNSIP